VGLRSILHLLRSLSLRGEKKGGERKKRKRSCHISVLLLEGPSGSFYSSKKKGRGGKEGGKENQNSYLIQFTTADSERTAKVFRGGKCQRPLLRWQSINIPTSGNKGREKNSSLLSFMIRRVASLRLSTKTKIPLSFSSLHT